MLALVLGFLFGDLLVFFFLSTVSFDSCTYPVLFTNCIADFVISVGVCANQTAQLGSLVPVKSGTARRECSDVR